MCGVRYYIRSHRKCRVDMCADSILKVLNMIPPIRARIRKVHIPLGRAPRSRHDRELIRLPPLHIAHGFCLGRRSVNESPGWPLRAGYLVRMSDARWSRVRSTGYLHYPAVAWDGPDPPPNPRMCNKLKSNPVFRAPTFCYSAVGARICEETGISQNRV